jgi:hypothetical protein
MFNCCRAGNAATASAVERNLVSVTDRSDIDPKVAVILHYLRDSGWLETNGAIIFSQYRATAEWVAEALCAVFFPDGKGRRAAVGVDAASNAQSSGPATHDAGQHRRVCDLSRS